jgi:hypothetical protein
MYWESYWYNVSDTVVMDCGDNGNVYTIRPPFKTLETSSSGEFGGVDFKFPITWNGSIKKISDISALLTFPDVTPSTFTLTVDPCEPNEPQCFGSGAFGPNAAPAKKIPGGTLVYPISTESTARFGLGLQKDGKTHYFDVVVDFGDGHTMSDSNYEEIESVISTAMVKTP